MQLNKMSSDDAYFANAWEKYKPSEVYILERVWLNSLEVPVREQRTVQVLSWVAVHWGWGRVQHWQAPRCRPPAASPCCCGSAPAPSVCCECTTHQSLMYTSHPTHNLEGNHNFNMLATIAHAVINFLWACSIYVLYTLNAWRVQREPI